MKRKARTCPEGCQGFGESDELLAVLVPVQRLVGPLFESAEPAEIIPALVTPPGVGPLVDHDAEEKAWESARARMGSQARERRRG